MAFMPVWDYVQINLVQLWVLPMPGTEDNQVYLRSVESPNDKMGN